MATHASPIEQLAINTIRTLSMDAVQQANSGHPGTPMALAPVVYTLWQRVLRYDPAQPQWPNRDRFVLSCGHASMLLYSILHLTGVKKTDHDGTVLDEPSISLDNIRHFRQLGSPCAGHPEFGEAAGIEMTTGPLGQGVATSVGMAIGAQWLAARYNRPDFDLFGYNVYALCSDGDIMEGIGCEAASVAGHLKLGNLCWIYDDNHITIEGHTDLAFSEDVPARFRALGWNTVVVDDANDLAALDAALQAFLQCHDRPTLIVVRSIIGYGSPNKANSHDAHGAPLGEEEVRLTKAAYGWPQDEKFLVPAEVRAHFADGIGRRGAALQRAWQEKLAAFQAAQPPIAEQLQRMWRRELPDGWDRDVPVFPADPKGMASRVSSGQLLNALAPNLPWLIGGSADLAPSNNTMLKNQAAGHLEAHNRGGRNLHFGVREHSMAAICNGLALTGLRPYCGTFFVFTDYLRPALRLSAIMHQPVLYVLTHDSIGLGEDGPTHQPVEHLAACRAIPNVRVFRPGDANEVAECYRVILQTNDRPAALVLTRQNLPTLDRTVFQSAAGTARGGYILSDPTGGPPQVILLASGSEVPICVEAAATLAGAGIRARIVSLPCFELFNEQDAAYRDHVLPPQLTARVAVEAGVRQCWDRYLGSHGIFIGMTSFGASAPAGTLYKHFGITADAVVSAARQLTG